MNDKEAALTVAIVQAILANGPDFIYTITHAMDHGARTPEEIRALRIEKAPEAYFAEAEDATHGTNEA